MVAAGVGLSAAALAFFIQRLWGHWGEVAAAFARADYLYVVPTVGLIGVMYGTRMMRWRVFLRPLRPVPYGDIASATLIGFMSSCVLPLRAGEVIRPYVLHKKSGLSFGHAAGTAMGLERVFDLIGACFLLFLTLALAPAAAAEGSADGSGAWLLSTVQQRALWFAVVTLVGLAVLTAVAFRPGLALRAAGLFLGLLPGRWRGSMEGFVRSAAESLGFLKRPARVALALLLSLGMWLCYPLSTWCLARGFSLGIPFGGILLAQVLVTVAVVMPQAAAFIGVFQVAAMMGVQLYGVPRAAAGAFATMLWAVNVVPITVVGLVVLWYEGFSLKGLARASRAAAEPEGE